MKIVVLAGGLSTERQVALTSGTGVCRALRERGHQAILVDMFLGMESYEGRLEDIFDAPDGLCGDNRVTEEAPDLEAVRRSRKDQGPSLLGKDVLAVCAMADIVFLALHGRTGEDGRVPTLFGNSENLPEFSAVICMPVMVNKSTRGVICLGHSQPHAVDETMRTFLRQAVGHLSL